MLTAIYENGKSINNPRVASATAIEVHQCADGQFDVRDQDGNRLIDPFRSQETANAAARMLSKSTQVFETASRLLETVRGE